MSELKYTVLVFFTIFTWVNLIVGIPTPEINQTSSRRLDTLQKIVEIKLPVKITTMDDLISWVKNVMKTMTPKKLVDLENPSNVKLNQVEMKPRTASKIMEMIQQNSPVARNSFYGFDREIESPWLLQENEILAPLMNADALLPLILGDSDNSVKEKFLKYVYNVERQKFVEESVDQDMKMNETKSEFIPMNSDIFKKINGSLPITIPFEAFITITRELSENQKKTEQFAMMKNLYKDFQRQLEGNPSGNKLNVIGKSPSENKFNSIETTLLENKLNNENKSQVGKSDVDEDFRKRQITAFRELLALFGFNMKENDKKTPEASTTSTAFVKPTKKGSILNQDLKPLSFQIELPENPGKNRTSERQELDDEDHNNEDDDDSEEEGSLGSVADLLPLALPILEDLSDPESDTDLIEVLSAAIPLVQGLSEGDGDGAGVQDLIDQILPVLKKIISGKNGQGSDLGALIGPLFGLLAPFIGPVLAPVIGPLIRTISNPPTEGSSLPALLTAISGPLSTPTDPWGMSPLSMVLAGVIAALSRELKPGSPGGLDLGGLVGSVLSGVIAGTSAGLSGHKQKDGHDQAGYLPYGANLQSQTSLSTVNVGFHGNPSFSRPITNPSIKRPSHVASTVNIGTAVRPKGSFQLIPHNRYQQTSLVPQKIASPRPYINDPGALHAAATTAGNGDTSYLPYGTTAVPANSVNPFELIKSSITDILQGGVKIISSLINAVVGLSSASSPSDGSSDRPPSNSYGSPNPQGSSGYGHSSG